LETITSEDGNDNTMKINIETYENMIKESNKLKNQYNDRLKLKDQEIETLKSQIEILSEKIVISN